MADETKEKVAEQTAQATALGFAELNKVLPGNKFSLVEGSAVIKLPGADILDSGKDEEDRQEAFERKVKVEGGDIQVNAGHLLLLRLKLWKEFLARSDGDAKALKKKVKDARDKVEKNYKANMSTVFKGQRKIEKAWRELDVFYKAARQSPEDSNLPVYLVNVDAAEMAKDDEVFKAFAEQFPKEVAFHMKDMVGLLVVPTWLRNEAGLKKFGDLAQIAKAHVFADFKDSKTFEDGAKLFERGESLETLKGNEPWKKNVTLIANGLTIRAANEFEGEGEDLYVSPSMIKAGMVFHADDSDGLQEAVAGDKHKIVLETADGSEPKMRFKVPDRSKFNKYGDCVNSIVDRGGKLVFWGVNTLSNDQQNERTQYSLVRVQEYLEKVLIEFLNGETFRENTPQARKGLQDRIQKFLTDNSGRGKMLQGGQVLAVESKPGDDRQVEIRLTVKKTSATETYNVQFVREGEAWDLAS